MKICTVVCLVLLSLSPHVVFAYGNTGNSIITGVVVDLNDGVIDVNGTWTNPDSCPFSGLIAIPMSGNYKDIEATLLTAYAMGKSVSFWVNGCTYSGGQGNAPSAYAIVVSG